MRYAVPHVKNLFQAIDVGPKGFYPMDWRNLIARKACLRRHIQWHLRRSDQQQKQPSMVYLYDFGEEINSCNFYNQCLLCWFLWLTHFIVTQFFMGQYTNSMSLVKKIWKVILKNKLTLKHKPNRGSSFTETLPASRIEHWVSLRWSRLSSYSTRSPFYLGCPDVLSLVRDPLSGNGCGSPNHIQF
jgi:hypothetical protein